MTAELVALTITLFVIGFCFGPLLWGPLSEQVSLANGLMLTQFSDMIFSSDAGSYSFPATLCSQWALYSRTTHQWADVHV